MGKRSLAEKLKQTTTEQRQENKDRFSNADDVLLKGISGKGKLEPRKELAQQSLVRDGFLIPKDDHAIILATRQRLASSGYTASKTEVIRMALKALETQSEKQLAGLYQSLDEVKRGRPKD